MGKLSNNNGFIHKIAVLAKDYYTKATIDNLFIFAGAENSWWKDPVESTATTSERIYQVYGWIEGLKANAPDKIDKILGGVAVQIIEKGNIPEEDRNLLKRLAQQPLIYSAKSLAGIQEPITIPDDIERLLEFQINGLPRAMHPLKFRREGLPALSFDNEYDVQSLFHALLLPWIMDIRPEEYTPSYAGSSTRIDFVLPAYNIVCEIKLARNKAHAGKIGDELILDIAHYKAHPSCKQLWIVIFDPHSYISNSGGLKVDLEKHTDTITIRAFVLGTK